MEPLPPEIVEFLFKHITSVEQLEILRVLKENPEKEWVVGELGPAVQANANALSAHIIAMDSRGLMTLVDAKNQVCRFGPKPELVEQVEQLLKFYKERPVSMIRLVYEKPTIQLRTFSDSFRLRDDKKS